MAGGYDKGVQKVRWTQKCAGGCGKTLTIGTRATRLHGGFFCTDCLNRHRVTCQALTGYGVPKRG